MRFSASGLAPRWRVRAYARRNLIAVRSRTPNMCCIWRKHPHISRVRTRLLCDVGMQPCNVFLSLDGYSVYHFLTPLPLLVLTLAASSSRRTALRAMGRKLRAVAALI